MSVALYAWGVLVLGGSLLLLGAAARAVAARLLPEWDGPVGVLGCVALVLGWVFAVSYVVGAVGAFRPWPLLILVDGGALAALLLATRHSPTAPRADPADPEDHHPDVRRIRLATGALAVVGAMAAMGSWLPATAHAYRYGIFEPDSTWYHGHFVVRFVQTGWLTRINAPGTEALSPYHPANAEVLDALLVLPWHRDLALPLVGLASLALLLLAAWCLGSRWNRGWAALLVAALIAATPTMRLSQPGSLKNDLLATALLTTGVALFAHSERRPAPVALAGAMLGLAVGTRTNLLAPVAVLLVAGLVLVLRRTDRDLVPGVDPTGETSRSLVAAASREQSSHNGARWLAPAAWVGATAAFGSYWYLRNWIRAGNPLPWTAIDVGPLHLDLARADQQRFADQTIWHWRHDPDLISSALRPGLQLGLGDGWWGWVALATVGLVAVALCLRRSPWLAGLLAAGGVGLLAYLVTPLTLVMDPSDPLAPFNVGINTRYALPAAALVLLAGACALPSAPIELGFAVVTTALIGWGISSHVLLTGLNSDGESADTKVALALGAGLAAATIFVLVLWPRRPALLLVPAIAAAALAFPLVDRYLDRRYTTPVPAYAAELWPAAQPLHDARIGIATSFVPYPYAGIDLSNRVSYIGVEQPGGLLRDAETCAEWIDALRERRITHVALTLNLSPNPYATLPVGTAREWTLSIPGARVIAGQGDATLIELPDRAAGDADGCG